MGVTGTVIRFDELKGYGFVAPDTGGDDVFIHVNDLTFDKHLVTPGSRVEFTLDKSDRGPKASSVSLAATPVRLPSSPSAAPVAPASHDLSSDPETCEVLSEVEYSRLVTEALLGADSTLTAGQIVQIRRRIVAIADENGWLE